MVSGEILSAHHWSNMHTLQSSYVLLFSQFFDQMKLEVQKASSTGQALVWKFVQMQTCDLFDLVFRSFYRAEFQLLTHEISEGTGCIHTNELRMQVIKSWHCTGMHSTAKTAARNGNC